MVILKVFEYSANQDLRNIRKSFFVFHQNNTRIIIKNSIFFCNNSARSIEWSNYVPLVTFIIYCVLTKFYLDQNARNCQIGDT
jgi:hypothetical protein